MIGSWLNDLMDAARELPAGLIGALFGVESTSCGLGPWELVGVVGVGLLLLALLFATAWPLYWLFSAPLRRQERARLLLDLIQFSLERGRAPEAALVEAASPCERGMNRRLRQLAARLRRGERLGAALEQTPGLLPPPAVALLRAGEQLGLLDRVLPACRRVLRDGVEHVSRAHHYLVLLAFVTTPVWVATVGALSIFVLPKLQQFTADLDTALPPLLEGLLAWHGPLIAGQLALLVILWAGVILYGGGPRLLQTVARWLPPWERWRAALPWNRRRLQRDFATLLAVALDAGLPEARAVTWAGEGTGSAVWRARAAAAVRELEHGVPLPEALSRLDEAGELRWRLANAVHARGGFLAALAGWVEALEARAFRDEQLTAQAVTTGLVLLNGVLVCLLTVGVFQFLVNVIWTGVLW